MALLNPTSTPDSRVQPPGGLLVAGSALSVVVIFAIATTAPLATVVLGLICCGLLHHVLEYRYLAGRFAGLFTPAVWGLIGLLIAGIMLTRAGLVPHPALVEIGLGYLVLGAGAWWGLAGRRRWLVLGLIAAAAVVSAAFPAWHFVVLTHLHNVLPVLFLWEWSRRLSPTVRHGLRAVQVLWVAVLPALILFGALDGVLTTDPGLVAGFIGDGARVVALHAPPDASVIVGSRFLTVFALMQSMHYVTWLVLMPLLTGAVTARAERAVPALRGPRLWLLGLGLAAVLGVVFVFDWFEGRTVYSLLASYHAYLEFPVLLAVLCSARSSGISRPKPS
ncbi:hypothetical protein [Enemella sp. A6]|uniref:hypothetical protein n=1 Tax=Enemella sp. A6 TaxID=3440152 RepID=UPI003EBFC271